MIEGRKSNNLIIRVFFAIAVIFLFLTVISSAAALEKAGKSQNKVLLMHTRGQLLTANIIIDKIIYSALKSPPILNISIYSKYLEQTGFNSKKSNRYKYIYETHSIIGGSYE